MRTKDGARERARAEAATISKTGVCYADYNTWSGLASTKKIKNGIDSSWYALCNAVECVVKKNCQHNGGNWEIDVESVVREATEAGIVLGNADRVLSEHKMSDLLEMMGISRSCLRSVKRDQIDDVLEYGPMIMQVMVESQPSQFDDSLQLMSQTLTLVGRLCSNGERMYVFCVPEGINPNWRGCVPLGKEVIEDQSRGLCCLLNAWDVKLFPRELERFVVAN